MLYVYFGNDVVQVREKAFAFVRTLTVDDTLVTHITPERYEEGMIIDLAQGSSLFSSTQVCVVDTLSDDSEILESALKHLEEMQMSTNHFVVIETSLNASNKKKIEVHAEKIEELTAEKIEKFNAFSLTDAFLRRDKKSLWILLIEAWKNGLKNEEIIGVLMWQVKVLRLAERTKSAEEAGQKEYVYNKAKRALSLFKKGELDAISRRLLTIYHDGHLGRHDTSLALERWALTL